MTNYVILKVGTYYMVNSDYDLAEVKAELEETEENSGLILPYHKSIL